MCVQFVSNLLSQDVQLATPCFIAAQRIKKSTGRLINPAAKSHMWSRITLWQEGCFYHFNYFELLTRIKHFYYVFRTMVARRELQPGDIILREKPVVTGPNLEQSQPVCLGCYALLQPKKFHACKKCKAPLCSPSCEDSELHKNECPELKQCPMGFYSSYDNGVLISRSKPDLKWANYQLILPIRVMLLKKHDLRKYKAFMTLQSHLEERRGTSAEETVRDRVVRLLEQYRFQDAFDDNIQSICGIFDTNSFELAVKGGKSLITGVFPEASMMMHSCYKNTRLTFRYTAHKHPL